AASRWPGPSALIRRSSSAPVNSLSNAHTQPRPAGIASVSGPVSLPWGRAGREPRAGAVCLDPAELVGAGELLVERAHPAEAGGDRVRLRADVVAVERGATLEP